MNDELSPDKVLSAQLAEDLDRSFQGLMETYYPQCLSYARRRLKNTAQAEDAVQESFIRAYYALQKYPAERVERLNIKSWLYTIVKRYCLNTLRDEHHQEYLSADTSYVENIRDEREIASPENVAVQLEANTKTGEYINTRLSKRYRECIKLSLQGLSVQEIAQQLDKPISSVRTYISKGRQELRKLLNKHGPTPRRRSIQAGSA